MNLLAAILRRGWTTSEFWVTLLGLALVVLYLTRPPASRDGRALLAIAIIVGCYALSRGLVKGRAARELLERSRLALVDDDVVDDRRHASERSRRPRV